MVRMNYSVNEHLKSGDDLKSSYNKKKMKFKILVSFDADEEPVTALSPPVEEDEQELLERAIAMSLEE